MILEEFVGKEANKQTNKQTHINSVYSSQIF